MFVCALCEAAPGGRWAGCWVVRRWFWLLAAVASFLPGACAPDPGVELRRILATERWVKPRLSLDQSVAVCAPPQDRAAPAVCGEGRPSSESIVPLLAIARTVPREMANIVAALLGSRPDVLAAEPRTSDEWSDLAAFELVQSSGPGGHRSAWRAAAAAERALELEPLNRRALFNRALAYEALLLDERARASWQAYLHEETDSLWRLEAEEHLRRLERPTISDEWSQQPISAPHGAAGQGLGEWSRRYVFEIRQTFLEDELPRWVEEPANADLCRNATSWLDIGEAIRDLSGDRWLADTVAWLENTCCQDRRKRSTAQAIRWTARALELFDRADSAASLELFERARRGLNASGSPLVALVDLYAAINVFALNRYAEAAERFRELEPVLRDQGYLFLTARAAWLQGTIALRAQDLGGAAEHYRRARQLFDRLHDRSHQAAVRGLLAETLARMGRYDEAWEEGLDGLRMAREQGLAHRLYTGCSLLGITAALEGDPKLAARYQECTVEHVRHLDNRPAEADALLWMAAWLHRSGRTGEAEGALAQASIAAAAIRDADEQAQAQADLALIEGALTVEEAPSSALERLARAIAFFERIGHHYYESDARLLQAAAARRAGDNKLAERALFRALALHERHRVGDSDPASRLAALYGARSVYDELVQFQLEVHADPWRALFFADRGKQDRYFPVRPATQSLETEIEATVDGWQGALAELPESTTLAVYQLLSEELLAWVLRPGAEPLLVRSSLAAASVESKELREDAWVELLKRPLEGSLAPDGLLVVVADKGLNDFPVALLAADEDEAPTVKTLSAIAATSLQDFLAPKRRPRLPAELASVEAFLAPRLAPTIQSLEPLAPSAVEASVLRRSFAAPRIWDGDAATVERFLASIRRPGIVHFSGHTLGGERDPLGSALLLSPAPSRPEGRVTARDLYALDGQRASLVSLAGCGTSAAPESLPLGLSLVRPFLSAGVPAVVGSLRPLQDELFERFVSAFYRELGSSGDVLAAFRRAQRELRRQASHDDRAWAEIQLYATRQIFDLRRDHV